LGGGLQGQPLLLTLQPGYLSPLASKPSNSPTTESETPQLDTAHSEAADSGACSADSEVANYIADCHARSHYFTGF
jgi:hypothetical protein